MRNLKKRLLAVFFVLVSFNSCEQLDSGNNGLPEPANAELDLVTVSSPTEIEENFLFFSHIVCDKKSFIHTKGNKTAHHGSQIVTRQQILEKLSPQKITSHKLKREVAFTYQDALIKVQEADLPSEIKYFLLEVSNSIVDYNTERALIIAEGFYAQIPMLDDNYQAHAKFFYDLTIGFIEYSDSMSGQRSNCSQTISENMFWGAVTSGLYGMAQGCITGTVLGFNPGSAAAGCIGGLIVGTMEGMALGAAAGAIQCAASQEEE